MERKGGTVVKWSAIFSKTFRSSRVGCRSSQTTDFEQSVDVFRVWECRWLNSVSEQKRVHSRFRVRDSENVSLFWRRLMDERDSRWTGKLFRHVQGLTYESRYVCFLDRGSWSIWSLRKCLLTASISVTDGVFEVAEHSVRTFKAITSSQRVDDVADPNEEYTKKDVRALRVVYNQSTDKRDRTCGSAVDEIRSESMRDVKSV